MFLHADISYKKPIRAQSGKMPNHVLRLPSHQAQERNRRVENEKRDKIIKKKKDPQALIGRTNIIRWMLRSLQHPADNHWR
jgi:hypothetical protein